MLTEKQVRNSKNQLLKERRSVTKLQKKLKKGSKNWNACEREILLLTSKIEYAKTVIKGNQINYKHLKTKKEIKSFVLKMHQIKTLVRETLVHDLESRDDDNLLCFKVWEKQGSKPTMTYGSLKSKLITGQFASPESIGRCRRALQQKYITLRGKLYEIRHQADEKFRTQYKLDF